MADPVGLLLSRLEIDLPADAPSAERLRTFGTRRRHRRRVVAVLVPVLLLAVVGGWLLTPDLDTSSHPAIQPGPQGQVFQGELKGFNSDVAITAVLPAGWRAAVPPGFDVDFRNADGTRGVAIIYGGAPGRLEGRGPPRLRR
jgi:hypothetical protein